MEPLADQDLELPKERCLEPSDLSEGFRHLLIARHHGRMATFDQLHEFLDPFAA
jgi:hypothetical protein